MHREHKMIIFAKGLGYALFGNILSGIMFISISPMVSVWFICLVAFIFTLFIYLSLLFTAGFRDGQKESVMLKNHRVESIPKYRWIIGGTISGAVMSIPTIIVLLGKLGAVSISAEFMFAYRFLSGTVYPLFHIAGVQKLGVSEFPLWMLLACMGVYLILSPVAAHIGFKFGSDENKKLSFMYEK